MKGSLIIMKVQFKGNLTRDAKVMTKKNGNSLVIMTVAENYNHKNTDGSWTRTGTAFRYCIAYDSNIKTAAMDFKKGQAVLIDGFTSILPATDKYPEREQIVITDIKKRDKKAVVPASQSMQNEFTGYEPLTALPDEKLSEHDYMPFEEEAILSY